MPLSLYLLTILRNWKYFDLGKPDGPLKMILSSAGSAFSAVSNPCETPAGDVDTGYGVENFRSTLHRILLSQQ